MAARRAPKVFTYKAARFLGSKHELASWLSLALKNAPTVGDRRQQLGGPDAPEWLVLNESRVLNGYVSGALVKYTPGTSAAALLDDPKASTASILKYDPPKEGQLRREWLESSMYFTAFKNHVVLMQSAALRNTHLEAYLRWLFGAIPATQGCGSLELNDKPAKATAERIRNTAVRRIEIGGELTHHSARQSATSAKHVPATTEQAMTVRGSAADTSSHAEVLQALSTLIGFKKFSTLNLKGLDESQLNYKLSLSIDHRKGDEDQSQNVLNRLGNAFRNAEGVDTTIELMDGSTVSGNELRLTGKEAITLYDGLPSTSEVFDLMIHWLQVKVSAGDIEP
jgi:hypothetical protein